MISADAFLLPAQARGYDLYTGVPCSFLTPIINRVISDNAVDYVTWERRARARPWRSPRGPGSPAGGRW